MFYPLCLFIGLRYTKSKRNNKFVSFVSLFSTSGIMLGVLALITVLSVMNGFENQLKTRILGAVPHALISNHDADLAGWEDQKNALLNVDRVKSVEGVVRSEAVIQTTTGLQGILFEGIDPAVHATEEVTSSIYSGELSALQPGAYNVIIGRGLANLLNVEVGDKVRIISVRGSHYTPLGRMPSQRNFTVAGLFNVGADVDSQLVLMNRQDAGRLIRIAKNHVTALRIYLDDPFAIESWTPPKLLNGEVMTDWRQTNGELFAAVKMEKNMIWLLLCLIISVAAFNILSSSVMVVNDKNAEVAILKTLGMSNTTLNFIFIIQGAWSGIVGALVGTGLGLLLSRYINEVVTFLGLHVVENGAGTERLLPVLYEPAQILIIMCGAMLLSLLATLYPAYHAGNLSPVKALRYE